MGKNTRAPKAPSTLSTRHVKAPKGTITIGIPTRGTCEAHFARTLNDLILWDQRIGRQHLHPAHPTIWTVGATQVVNARNTLVDKFLTYDSDWLLMLDDDQLYPHDLLEYLIESADPVERPIVGVPVWRLASNGDGGPTRVTHNVMDLHESGGFVEWTEPFPEHSVIQVAAVGTGCLLVHRKVLEDMRDWCDERGHGRRWCWFRHNVYQPADMSEGEDLYFCRVAGLMGVPVYITTFTTLQHVKSLVLTGPIPEGLCQP